MNNPLKISILIIDSNMAARLTAKKALEHDGYIVVDFPDVSMILGVAKDMVFDILIVDPFVLNSQKLIERMSRTNPYLRVIFVSEYSPISLETIGLCPKGVEVTRKPFSEAEIVCRVQSALTSGKIYLESNPPMEPVSLRILTGVQNDGRITKAKPRPV